ncbi:hypothetical protein JO84_gp062 [Aureococcus anophagefferens virus]|uniref:DUF5904 domain-containing protein n=1 Tax=Aureococcus anophagefferens virus TaxID=1474867 RepID=A0A076FH32_9VIRU|nr:hypothetical protein JO84_gp062 [Aureococcus anophagefferens virus]AII17047.1 hypothetical protein AaV_062 [Aureococcus anophagefferens virus]UOG94362.1 hypothetical protein MKD35_327 [Aureococcus anophagefferens virus]
MSNTSDIDNALEKQKKSYDDVGEFKKNYKKEVGKYIKSKVKSEIQMSSIFIIFFISFIFIVTSSTAIGTYEKYCKDNKNKVDIDLNKFFIASLSASITVPVTLLLAKFGGSFRLTLFTIIFSILGFVAAAATIHWSNNCKKMSKKEKNKRIAWSVGGAFSYILIIAFSIFLNTSNSKASQIRNIAGY